MNNRPSTKHMHIMDTSSYTTEKQRIESVHIHANII